MSSSSLDLSATLPDSPSILGSPQADGKALGFGHTQEHSLAVSETSCLAAQQNTKNTAETDLPHKAVTATSNAVASAATKADKEDSVPWDTAKEPRGECFTNHEANIDAARVEETKAEDAKVERELAKTEVRQDVEPAAIPQINATVGMIEVDGLQIEMLSLAQLREQTLAQEKAKAEAKKAKQAATRAAKAAQRAASAEGAENEPKRPRKPRKTKPKLKEQEITVETDDAALAANGDATVAPESIPVLAEDNGQVKQEHQTENQETLKSTQDDTSSSENHTAKLDDGDESGAEPTLAQSLLNKLIANVEQLETQASHVADDAVSKEAAAAAEKAQAKSNELTLNPNVTPNLVDDPQWDDVEEMSPEQIEKYSQMGLKEGDVCPVCSNGLLMLRHSYKSDFLGCSNFPNCKFHLFTGKRSAVVTLKELNSLCPVCHGNLEVKKGRFGIFIGCSNYPSCDYVYHRKDEVPQVQITCPMCKQGHLVERRGRSGKSFYGCDNFPTCNFSVFGVPVEVKCEECGFPVMYKKKVKNGTALICGDPKCPSRKKRKRQMLK